MNEPVCPICKRTHEPACTVVVKKKRAGRGTFDRNAYQRELMRKRRAKK